MAKRGVVIQFCRELTRAGKFINFLEHVMSMAHPEMNLKANASNGLEEPKCMKPNVDMDVIHLESLIKDYIGWIMLMDLFHSLYMQFADFKN